MIYLYRELEKKGYSDYNIKKLLDEKKLYYISKGVYSTSEEYNYLEYLSKKHPNIIFTLETACFCYGLIKKIGKNYKVVTKQKDRKILDEDVKQIYMSDNLYPIGMKNVKYLGFNIKIYDLERLIIEVVRNKTNLDYDVYKQIMSGYKKIIKLINKTKIDEYAKFFSDEKIMYRIEKELYQK